LRLLGGDSENAAIGGAGEGRLSDRACAIATGVFVTGSLSRVMTPMLQRRDKRSSTAKQSLETSQPIGVFGVPPGGLVDLRATFGGGSVHAGERVEMAYCDRPDSAWRTNPLGIIP
jgi:hypothetical protein